ncbi:MAG: aminotransferase class I/II-fold pyridoxal phosphate-dependent enzyme [Candidatus Omnitrophica bacterium]|nr:aminotransferase class I/II-fold pyridoxal phosphate-dependent enzyme [Candidatus Omnitrophota bacterium]
MKKPNFVNKIEGIFYQKILRPIFYNSRLGRRSIFGYAGTGLFVDYVYRNKPSGYNKLGYLIDKALLSLPSAKATKEKKERITKIIQSEIISNTLNNKTTKIVDLGSGPARYLVELSKDMKNDRLQTICFDTDKSSLEYGRSIAKNCPIEYRLANITKLERYKKLAQKIRWRPNILIVSTCYEFLDDGSVRSSIEDIYKALDADGVLIIAHQTENPNKKLFDYLVTMKGKGGWNINYRKPFLIKKWLTEAGFKNTEIQSDRWNMYYYYIARKSGNTSGDTNTKTIFKKSFDYKRATEQRSKNIYQYMRGFNPVSGGKALRGQQEVIMLASNNYLGLSLREEIIKAANDAIRKYGASTTSSRILTGNLDIHEELQEKLANFLRTEDALVFSTGYMCNLGVISSLLGEGDMAFFDRDAHASLIDGARLSNGETRFFAHNDVGQLEALLKKNNAVENKLVVCDGVYSMDGDLAPLPEICALAEKYCAGLIVDDGHVTGIFGENGRGTAEHFKLEGKVDLLLGSLGKALASVGGFAAGNHTIIDHLRHTSRPLLFSTALSPVHAAVSIVALEIIVKEPWLRKQLWGNTFKMKQGLLSLGYNLGKTQSPLIPVIIGEEATTYKMVMALEESGVIVDGVSFPAVKKNLSRIRMRMMATHTDKDLDFVLSVFKDVGKKLGVI